MSKPIVVVGSINLDLVAETKRIPIAGETVAGRVTAGDLFTFRRLRAGGVGGILPVCEDLCGGTHISLSTFILSGACKEFGEIRSGILRKSPVYSKEYGWLAVAKNLCDRVSRAYRKRLGTQGAALSSAGCAKR